MKAEMVILATLGGIASTMVFFAVVCYISNYFSPGGRANRK